VTADAVPGPTIAVVGEALIDLVELEDDAPRLAHPGGSPYNVALGLARLGRRTCFVGRLSRDPLGAVLRRHAERSAVDLSLAVEAAEPSTIALVELDAEGQAQYHFGIDGTADFLWSDAELRVIPTTAAAVHFGSLASWLPPGDAVIARRVAELRDAGVTVTYDPNVRPLLQTDRAVARAQVEQAVPLAHLVKTSEEDLAYLYPGQAAEDVAALWLRQGVAVVVVTRGGDGAAAFSTRWSVRCAPVRVDVVDTVGAGDAFTSGLLDAALEHGVLAPAALAELDDATASALLEHASLVAAVTCSRAGANPPRRAELTLER
jgi:fructokinase